jgi:flagellar assembly factor FliW
MTTMIARAAAQLSFIEPLPGFPDADYTLTRIDDQGLLYSLRSAEHPELRFVLSPAAVFFPDYRPDLADALAKVLGSDEVDVLLMLTVGTSLSDATANLRAPIVYAPSTGRALQVILDDATLPMHAPLIPDAAA